MAHAAHVHIEIGRTARDAVIGALTGSEFVVSVEQVGGYETFNSSSYNDGNGNVTFAPPVDNTVWQVVIGGGA